MCWPREEGASEPDEELAGDLRDGGVDDVESDEPEGAADAVLARQRVGPVDVAREEPAAESLAFALLGAALAFPIARMHRRRRS